MIPNPINIIEGAAGSVAGWTWDQVATGIAKWVLGAIAELIDGVLNFLKTAARPDVTDAWFSGSGSPYAAVRNVSAVLLLAFLLAGIIQGLMAGDIGGMIRRVSVDAPVAVLGMIATTVVVKLLLDLTDALSTAVLGGADGTAIKFLEGFGVGSHLLTGGFSTVLIGLIAVVGTVMVWIELMVRSSLMYLLVALSPLAFAASVWPAAKGLLRRLIELMLAVIVSKLVISIALAVGVAALGGAGGAAGPSAGVGEFAAQGLGTLVIGTSIICLAAFSPFMVLKLIPMAEGALMAQGMSRAPLNTARSGMSTAYYTQAMGRLAGGHGSRGAGGESPPADADTPPFGPPGEAGMAGSAGATGDLGGAGAGAASGGGSKVAGGGAVAAGGGAGAAGGASGAEGTAGAAGGTAAAGGGAAAAGAVAGPVAIGVVAVEGAKMTKDLATSAVDQAATSVDEASGGGSGSAGWQRIANEPPTPDPGEPPPREPS